MSTIDRDSDERIDIKSLIAEVIDKPDEWMNQPNNQLGGKKPREMIETAHEERLRELVRAIKLGMFT